jgi:formylglycine-generating enzyme required for sulfatase activity
MRKTLVMARSGGAATLILVITLAAASGTGAGPGADQGALPSSFVNSLGMQMIRVEPGEFLMGLPDAMIPEHFDGELRKETRQHAVQVSEAFYVAATEVTNAQYRAFARAEGTANSGSSEQGEALTALGAWVDDVSEWQRDDCPVTLVSWHDANAFCDWLSGKEGVQYSLPTAVQWECCSRAGSPAVYFFGADPEELGTYAWYSENSTGHPHPVATRKPNAWGLYDTLGNAEEWTRSTYKTLVTEAPSAQEALARGSSRPRTVQKEAAGGRGGSYHSDGRECTCGWPIGGGLLDERAGHLGFRVVCSAGSVRD